MAQNIYDDAEFFAGYARLPRSVEGLDGAPEWPSLRALLPDLAGCSVLDLGCGYGWFCRWARDNGAARVLGIDISARMLARAQAGGQDAAIAYTRADLEALELPQGAFDLVYSSLALHYVADLGRLLAQVHGSMTRRGSLVFSVEHPIYSAGAEHGWLIDGAGRRFWSIDRYFDEGPRVTDWLAQGVIKEHRTITAYVNRVLQAGFALAHLEEWTPTPAQLAAQPDLADERRRPTFLLVAARR